MLQRQHSGLKPKGKKAALSLRQITQLGKSDIHGTVVTKHQKHLSKALTTVTAVSWESVCTLKHEDFRTYTC